MSQSYRRQKPTVSVRRGLRAPMNQVRQEWEGTTEQKQAWGRACRDLRAAYGMTDGLRLNQSDFNAYLAKRQEQDRLARGW